MRPCATPKNRWNPRLRLRIQTWQRHHGFSGPLRESEERGENVRAGSAGESHGTLRECRETPRRLRPFLGQLLAEKEVFFAGESWRETFEPPLAASPSLSAQAVKLTAAD